MTPFHLVTTDAADAVIYDADLAWAGRTVNMLSDVPALIDS
jgi:hypothetical protein